jgi:hypothetical protein
MENETVYGILSKRRVEISRHFAPSIRSTQENWMFPTHCLSTVCESGSSEKTIDLGPATTVDAFQSILPSARSSAAVNDDRP